MEFTWSCDSDLQTLQQLLCSPSPLVGNSQRERLLQILPATCLHWDPVLSHLGVTFCDATNVKRLSTNSLRHQCVWGCYWAPVLWAVGIRAVIWKSWICSAANLKLTPTARIVLTFILSRYWIGESIANSSKQWSDITNLYGLAQKCQLTTDKYRLSGPKPTQEKLGLFGIFSRFLLFSIW